MFSSDLPRPRTSRIWKALCFAGLFVALCTIAALWAWHMNAPHPLFPIAHDVVIEEGMTLSHIADLFEEAHAVRSSFLLYASLLQLADDPVVQAGSYRFPEPLSTYAVARALLMGTYQSPLLRVTFPEGFVIADMRSYYPAAYTPVPAPLPQTEEGFLFPDTYYVTPDTTEDALFQIMRQTFTEKLASYTEDIQASGFTETDIVILASIIEREAKDTMSKKRVSGILHNRLKIGMALQVDATLDYILGKTSAELTIDDLEKDSPFNTYTRTGLPPHPIANPGIESIEAVLFPEETPYLYYLTADDGTFYYARTFEEHKENKARYLR
jgi:UPF0755 protein